MESSRCGEGTSKERAERIVQLVNQKANVGTITKHLAAIREGKQMTLEQFASLLPSTLVVFSTAATEFAERYGTACTPTLVELVSGVVDMVLLRRDY